jgi:hypothetical protein
VAPHVGGQRGQVAVVEQVVDGVEHGQRQREAAR